MMKLSAWLAKMIVTIGIASIVSVYVTWTTVSLFADKLMQDFHLGSAVQMPQFSDLLSKLSDNLNIHKSFVTTAAEVNAVASPGPSPSGNGTAGSGAGRTDPSSSVQGEDNPPKDAVTVWSQAVDSERSGAAEQRKQLVMSADDFFKKKENMSNEDKMKVFTILANRLPENELQQLSTYVEDGITQDEAVLIEEMIQKYVKPEEMDQLEAILKKY